MRKEILFYLLSKCARHRCDACAYAQMLGHVTLHLRMRLKRLTLQYWDKPLKMSTMYNSYYKPKPACILLDVY